MVKTQFNNFYKPNEIATKTAKAESSVTDKLISIDNSKYGFTTRYVNEQSYFITARKCYQQFGAFCEFKQALLI